MPVIDSLEVQIQGKADSANKSLDNLIQRLGLVAEGISAIGSNKGLDSFAKSATEAAKRLSDMTKGISASIESQAKRAAKSFEQITEQYKSLGKGFVFKGSVSDIEKQIDKYTNSLETAKLKKEELETAGKTEGKAYEAAVAKTIEYTNVIESLKRQLEDIQAARPQPSITISGIEEARQKIESVAESIRETVSIPASALNYDKSAMIATFGEAAGNIENWAQAVEMFGENAGRILNESSQLNFNIGGIEETEQKMNNFSGQIENMKNLLLKTFSDIKSGDLWRYLSVGVGDYVKAAQKAAGIKIYTEEYRTVLSDIERTERALEKLEQKKRDLQAEGTGEESREWQKVASEIAAAQSRLDSYTNTRKTMETSGTDVQFSGGFDGQSALKNMGAVAEGFKSALSGIAKAAGTAFGAVSKFASAVAKLASGLKGVISKLSSMAKSLIGLKGASKGANASLGGGLKTLLKYSLGIRSLFALMRKMRAVIKDAFGNLSQYSSETNASLSALQSSLGALKNSLAVAFAPIVNVAAPYLSMLIDMLTQAFNKIGQFFAALTGKSFAAQAKKNFSDYAAGVSKAGTAAKKAGKDVQQGTRPFDELKAITTNKDEDAGGGGSAAEVSPSDMFTTVPIEGEISDFVQKIKDAWAEADFTEIGAMLGIKLKSALDSVPWEPIQEAAAKIGKSIATLINGFVEVDGLADSIGRTIGEAINTGIIGINSFLDNTHWDSVGIFIGEGLNGIVNTVDWEGLGHLFAAKWNAIFETLGNVATTFDWTNFGLQLATSVNTFITDFNWAENGAHLGELIKGLLDTLITFLEETNWQELGNGIADFIGGIDWGGILERLAEGIGAALGGLAALIWGLIEDAWGKVVEWWEETAFEDGKFTMSGLLNGVWDGIKNIASWIKEHIFQPFIDGFKKAFGIASPSKVMKEQGGFIMQGLFDGVTSLVDKVLSVFTKIKDKIVNIWGDIKAKTSEIWGGIKNAIKIPINGIISLINGLVGGTVKGINGMINAMNKLSFDIPDWVPVLGGKTFGFDIPNLTAPQIPYLAKGGLVTQYTHAIIGESGMEAVLPLTNERTMGMIADSIYENASYKGGFDFNGGETGRLIAEVQKQNSLLTEQNKLLKAIYQKPTMEIGDVHKELVNLASIEGGNSHGGKLQRLVVATELY